MQFRLRGETFLSTLFRKKIGPAPKLPIPVMSRRKSVSGCLRGKAAAAGSISPTESCPYLRVK